MGRFNARIQNFMVGRNGSDALGRFLFGSYASVFFLNLFVGFWALSVLGLLILGWELFRFLSRNLYARRAENAGWIRFWGKVGEGFRKTGWKIRETWRKMRIPRVKVKRPEKSQARKPAAQRKAPAPKTDRDHAVVSCPVCAGNLTVRKIRGERLAMCPHCHNEVRIKI